jgi:hypothetical protein
MNHGGDPQQKYCEISNEGRSYTVFFCMHLSKLADIKLAITMVEVEVYSYKHKTFYATAIA